MADNIQLVYFSEDTKEFMRKLYKNLPEREKRLYAAIEALKLEDGGQKYISEILGCDPHTISKGIDELYNGSDLPEGYSRKPTAGAKKIMDKIENIDEIFLDILKDKTAGSPMDEEIIWTNLKPKEISEEFKNKGYEISEHVVKQLLEKHSYKQRKMKKTKTFKDVENRNEQFENIDSLKEKYVKDGNPIISMDVKKKSN
jgi:hypothetical protein